MGMNHQHAVVLQIQRAVVQLRFGVQVVAIALTLQPAVQSPLRRGKVTWLPSSNGIGGLLQWQQLIEWLGSFEGQWRIRGVWMAVLGRGSQDVARQIHMRDDSRSAGKHGRIDVVAATSKVVVGVPRVGGGQHGQPRRWDGRRNYPGEAEEFARLTLGEEVVETRLGRRRESARLTPVDPGLRKIAIRQRLNGRARAMLVEPAQK